MRIKSLSSLVVLMIVFSLIIGGATTVIAEEDIVVIGQSAEAPGLHTLIETSIPVFERVNLISEPLVKLNHNLEPIPWLASEFEILDGATRIKISLRDDVLWHDGSEFTAADVKYTYEWLLDEDNPGANRDIYADIDEIEIINDYQMVFHLSSPNSFMINNMARLGIIPEEYHEEVGYEDFAQAPLGTGPYVHEEWSRGEYHTMTAFEDYWGGVPNFYRLDFRPIPEDSSRLLAFEAGEIDMYHGNVITDDIARLEEDPNFLVKRTATPRYNYVALNQESTENPEIMQDPYFRKAVTHALDREGIIENIKAGLGQPGKSAVMPYMDHFNDELDYPEYDMDKAREYIEMSSLEGGETVNLYVTEGDFWESIAEILAYELNNLDINVNIRIEEYGAYLDRLYDTKDFDMYVFGWTGQIDPDRAMYRQFHSQGLNRVGFYNERVDELLDKGRTVDPNSQESIDIYREIQALILEDNPKAFIDYDEEITVLQANFEGFEVHPYNANNWIQLFDRVTRSE